ncbi:MAG: HDIG domain-containing protein [Muribaculaceae bacterium]|nr:HDIG domain-containing protein [Muribaculaceae bacterium]
MVLSDKQIDKNRREILRLLISTQRDGIESVIDYLYSSGFFLVPSSRKRHHCWKGGLAQHSLSVCNIALSLDSELPRSSIVLCALLHDICKATKLYYDDKGNLHNRKTHIEGHGIRSIKLLKMLNLTLILS